MLEENVATPQRGASTIEGQVKDVLLNSDSEMSSGEQNYTTHVITGDNSKGITVQLSQPYIINCIRMLLWDRDNRSYSYFIEVSLDKKNWQRVVDRTSWLCRSWQELFFEPQVIRWVWLLSGVIWWVELSMVRLLSGVIWWFGYWVELLSGGCGY